MSTAQSAARAISGIPYEYMLYTFTFPFLTVSVRVLVR